MAEPIQVREGVSLRLVIYALVFLLISLALFAAGSNLEEHHYKTWSAIANEVGSALLVSVVLGIFWDAFGKRAYTDEILAKAGIAKSVADAGVERITTFRSGEIQWQELFRGSSKLDIFVAYGSTWRNTHVERINHFLAESNSCLRVVLPDPASERVVAELAARFQSTPTEIQAKIEEAARSFSQSRGNVPGKVEVRFTQRTPLFSFYLFSSGGVFALYNHRSGREEPVPSMQCDRRGTFYSYLNREFEGLYEDANVYSETKQH